MKLHIMHSSPLHIMHSSPLHIMHSSPLHIMHSSPPSCYIIPLRSRYSSQHALLKHRQAMKDVVFWDITPCGSRKKNRYFGGTSSLRAGTTRILVTLKMEAICSSVEYFLLPRASRRHIAEDNILHWYRRDNIPPYSHRQTIFYP
jgi:hypothetical protein